MKIDRHISDLLYDHDCVIVPSFGGFLASYQSAQVQAIQHIFNPPSKKIAFNVFLKNNDGLLANYVAQQEKLTYADALKDIERFRIEALSLLDSGKQIIIEDVGTLFYDNQKNLQFEPAKRINYFQDAFGLAAVQSSPVKRDEQRKKIERQIREAVSIRSSVKPPRVKSIGTRSTAKKVLNTVIISGALIWLSFNVYMIAPHKGNISSLNPFSYSSAPAKVETPVVAPKKEVVKSVAPAPIQKPVDAVDNSLPDNQTAPDNSLALANPTNPKGEPIALATILQNQKNFYIIAGVFHEPGNAEKLVETLRQEGFDKAEIVNPMASAKKVCYSSFAYRKDAVAALEELHSAKKEAWILAR